MAKHGDTSHSSYVKLSTQLAHLGPLGHLLLFPNRWLSPYMHRGEGGRLQQHIAFWFGVVPAVLSYGRTPKPCNRTPFEKLIFHACSPGAGLHNWRFVESMCPSVRSVNSARTNPECTRPGRPRASRGSHQGLSGTHPTLVLAPSGHVCLPL